MNEVSELIAQTAEKIMQNLSTKEVISESESGIWPKDLWRTLADAGMTKIGISENLGGSGGSLQDAFSFLQIAGKYSAPIPLVETLLANQMLSTVHLPLSDDPITFGYANDSESLNLKRDSNGWKLFGSLRYVPYARFSKYIVVVVKSEETNKIVLVDLNECEIKTNQNLAGEARDQVLIKEVSIPESHVVQTWEFDESKIMLSGALLRAVQMTGALERIFELTVSYSKQRVQFGRPIGQFQAIQQQIAILAGELTAAKSIVNKAVKAFETGGGEKEIMMAKIRVGEAASKSARIAHQVHGAIGITEEYELQQSTQRLWSWRDEFGNETYWAAKLGQEVISMGAKRLWPFITMRS